MSKVKVTVKTPSGQAEKSIDRIKKHVTTKKRKRK